MQTSKKGGDDDVFYPGVGPTLLNTPRLFQRWSTVSYTNVKPTDKHSYREPCKEQNCTVYGRPSPISTQYSAINKFQVT